MAQAHIAGLFLLSIALLPSTLSDQEQQVKVCALPKGKRGGYRFQGGLANSIGCANGAIAAAIEYNLPIVWPVVKCSAHDLIYEVTNFFVDYSDKDADVEKDWQAASFPEVEMPGCCKRPLKDRRILDRHMGGSNTHSLAGRLRSNAEFDRQLAELAKPLPLYTVELEQAQALGCTHILGFPQVGMRCDANFNYVSTRTAIRQRYFRHGGVPTKDSKPWLEQSSRPIKIAVHHRMGDLTETSRRAWLEKRLRPAWPMFALDMILSVVKGECLDVALVTEASSKHVDIAALLAYFNHLDVQHRFAVSPQPSPRKSGISKGRFIAHEAMFSFDIMVQADILVASGSGFSRLAAVLRNRSTLAFEMQSHPLSYLNYTTFLPNHPVFYDRQLVEKHLPDTVAAADSRNLSAYHTHVQEQLKEHQSQVEKARLHLARQLQRDLDTGVWVKCQLGSDPQATLPVVDASSSFEGAMEAHHEKKEEILRKVHAALKQNHPELVSALERYVLADITA